MLLIPESFIIFSMLYDHVTDDMLLSYFVTCVTIIYIILYYIFYLSPKLKKVKVKTKNKREWKNKIK